MVRDRRTTGCLAGRHPRRGVHSTGSTLVPIRSSAHGPMRPASRQWDELAALVDRAPEVIRTANRLDPRPPRRALVDDPALWQAAVESAERVLTIEQPVQAALGVAASSFRQGARRSCRAFGPKVEAPASVTIERCDEALWRNKAVALLYEVGQLPAVHAASVQVNVGLTPALVADVGRNEKPQPAEAHRRQLLDALRTQPGGPLRGQAAYPVRSSHRFMRPPRSPRREGSELPWHLAGLTWADEEIGDREAGPPVLCH